MRLFACVAYKVTTFPDERKNKQSLVEFIFYNILPFPKETRT